MLLTARDAANKLNISARAVYALIEAGLIPSERTDRGLTLIPDTAIVGLALTAEDIVKLVRTKKNSLVSTPRERTPRALFGLT